MIADQMLVEMPRHEAVIARPIQSLDFVASIDRNTLARAFADPAIEQPGLAVFFVPPGTNGGTSVRQCPAIPPRPSGQKRP